MKKPWQNEELLREYYCERDMSMNEVAELFGCSQFTISNYCNQFDIETNASGGKPRASKATLITTKPEYGGYEVWNDSVVNNQVRVHRLLAVAEHGFDAVADNHVHHKNGIPWDNRPENLEILDISEHMSLHHEQGDYNYR